MSRWQGLGLIGLIVVVLVLQLPLLSPGGVVSAGAIVTIAVAAFFLRQRIISALPRSIEPTKISSRDREARVLMVAGYALLILAAIGPYVVAPLVGNSSRWLWAADITCLILGLAMTTWSRVIRRP